MTKSASILHRIKSRVTFFRDAKHLFHLFVGFSLFLIYALKHLFQKDVLYRAAGDLYGAAQSEDPSLSRTIALNFFNSPLCIVVRDFYFWKNNVGRERLSTLVLEEYSDENVGGYCGPNYDPGAEDLREQQRGLILPLVEKAIRENEKRPLTVVELGCANADVVAELARQFPDVNFLGVDFFIKMATEKHASQKNLSFVKGYALELFEQGKLQGDIFFGCSTASVFTPKELVRYLNLMKTAGVQEIILNDPTWYGFTHEKNKKAISRHLSRYLWFHNHRGYLPQAGYEIIELNYFPYKSPKSARSDLYISLIRARLVESGETVSTDKLKGSPMEAVV